MVLAFRPGVLQILSRSYISAMHSFICFFVKDFVRKITTKTAKFSFLVHGSTLLKTAHLHIASLSYYTRYRGGVQMCDYEVHRMIICAVASLSTEHGSFGIKPRTSAYEGVTSVRIQEYFFVFSPILKIVKFECSTTSDWLNHTV